jgi:hypothetical protein
MFVRSAGTANDAAESAVIAAMPDDARKDAKNSWFPAALGKGVPQSYDPMLGVAQAGDEPDHAVVITISQSQSLDSMLSDLQAGKSVAATSNFGQSMFGAGGEFEDAFGAGLNRVPRDRVLNPNSPFYTGKHRGDQEPDPYRGQKTAAWGL